MVLTFRWCCPRRYRLLWNLRFLNGCHTEGMLDTSVRLLRLLSLLQTRREWSGQELAERLGGHHPDRAQRHRAAAPPGLCGAVADRSRRRLSARPRCRDAAAAAGRRRGRGRRARAECGGRGHRHRDRGDLAARDDQARADAAGPAAAAAGRAAPGHGVRSGRRTDRRRRCPGRRWPPPAATPSSCASTTRPAPARRSSAGSSRIGWSTPGTGGTCWPGTATGRTGVRSGPTEFGRGCPPGRGSPRASRRRTSRATSSAAPRPRPGAIPARVRLHAPAEVDRRPDHPGRRPADPGRRGHPASWRPAATRCSTWWRTSPRSTSPFDVLDPPELRDLLRSLADRYRAAVATTPRRGGWVPSRPGPWPPSGRRRPAGARRCAAGPGCCGVRR